MAAFSDARDQRRPERRPTIRDVAAEAGVSKSVASRVYSGSTHVSDTSRQRVLAAAQALDYRPNWVARSLAGDRHDFVGILVADLHNPVFAEVVDAARAQLSRSGQVGLLTSAMLPTMPNETPDKSADNEGPQLDGHALALFGDLRPSRLLVVGTVPNPERILESSFSARVVTASAVPDNQSFTQVVRGDDEEGMRLVIEHLIALGHERIAHVGGAGGPVSAIRASAYARLMFARGLGDFVRIEPSDNTQQGGYAATRALLDSSDPPTAITAVNDLAAIGALVAADDWHRRTGLSVSITGYDNTFLADLPQISLTTVDPGNAEIGIRAAQLLIDGPDTPIEILIRPRLAARSSTQPMDWPR